MHDESLSFPAPIDDPVTRLDGVLGIVQAGGQGSRLGVLTRHRAKPALAFAGEYQLIDFALSSMAHAMLPDVWVSVQYRASSLDHHLSSGRPWDLDRTRGGYRRVVPEQGGSKREEGFSTGNADDLYRLWGQVKRLDPDTVIVMSADHVFALDLRDVIDAHRAVGAECTVVTAEVSRQEAAHKAVVTIGPGGRVTSIDYKPERAESTTVLTEIFVYDAAVLGDGLRELSSARRKEMGGEADEHDSGLGDFGEELLPWFVARGTTYAYPMEGYWRDVGRIESYLGAHRDLLAGRIDAFTHERMPILTRRDQRLPARIDVEADVNDAYLSVGCVIGGTVHRSVLGPGVVVEPGATVVDAVIGKDTVVRSGARVHTAIVDKRCVIGRDAVVGFQPAGTRPREGDIAVLGQEVRVKAGAQVEPGSAVEPRRGY